MAKESEHDRSVERLLKATPRSALPGSPSSACLDAGAIASWAEAALAADEATRVEAHLADCQRCQAVLAALVRSEPPAAPAAPVWKRWAVLLPVAAATAALALWIAWPQRQTPGAVATVAETPSAAERRPPPAPVPISPPAADAAGATTPVAPPMSSMSASPVFRSVAPPAATPVPLVVPPPPTPLAPAASAQAAAKPVAVGASPLTDLRLTTSAGVAGAVGATEPIVVFDSPAAFGGAGGAPAAAGAGRGGAGGGRPAALREPTLKSSVTRWRILASRDLERSTDDGRTWARVMIDPSSSLANGAAPSPLVCWLVGRAGLVLVTNDAGHFTRLGFPEAVDLLAVQATDLLNATVTTADGRTFATTDGGKTWTEKHLP